MKATTRRRRATGRRGDEPIRANGSNSTPAPTAWSMSAVTHRRGRPPRRCLRWRGHDPVSCPSRAADPARRPIGSARRDRRRRRGHRIVTGRCAGRRPRVATVRRVWRTPARMSTVVDCSYRTSPVAPLIVDLTGATPFAVPAPLVSDPEAARRIDLGHRYVACGRLRPGLELLTSAPRMTTSRRSFAKLVDGPTRGTMSLPDDGGALAVLALAVRNDTAAQHWAAAPRTPITSCASVRIAGHD